MLLDTLASAWAAWRAGIHSTVRKKAAVASALSHWQNNLLAKAWAAWRARVRGRAQLQSTLMSVAKYFSQPLLADAFEEWALHVEERKIAQACVSLATSTRNALCIPTACAAGINCTWYKLSHNRRLSAEFAEKHAK